MQYEADMTEKLTEAQRHEIEGDLAAARAESVDRIRHQMTLAEKSLSALMVANGGALIGMFTFIGNVAAKSPDSMMFNVGLIWGGFSAFCVGVALALIAHLGAFLSQDRFYQVSMLEVWRHQRSLLNDVEHLDRADELRFHAQGGMIYYGSLVLSILSILAFMIGCGFSLAGVLPR